MYIHTYILRTTHCEVCHVSLHVHVLYARWRSLPILHRPAVRRHLAEQKGPSSSQNSAPWTATLGFLPLIGWRHNNITNN